MAEICGNLQNDGLCKQSRAACEIAARDEPTCPDYIPGEQDNEQDGAFHEALHEGLMEQYGD